MGVPSSVDFLLLHCHIAVLRGGGVAPFPLSLFLPLDSPRLLLNFKFSIIFLDFCHGAFLRLSPVALLPRVWRV